MSKPYIKQIGLIADEAVKIRCKFCDIRETCTQRAQKEAYEETGMMTYCTLTPNRPKKRNKR